MIRTTAGDPPAPKVTIEYQGFRSTETRREYRLLTHAGQVTREFVVGIPHECFAKGFARLQDGPEICYEKIRRELSASADQLETNDFTVTPEELAAFKVQHAPPPRGHSKKRAAPVAATEEGPKADADPRL